MATYATTVAQYLEGQFRPAGYEFESDGFKQGAIQRMLSQGLVDLVGGGGATAKNSVEIDDGDIQLVGDATAPGNDKVYGTDGAGAKGWKDDPAGSGVWPLPEPNVQAASYTLVLDDAGKAVEMDVAGANDLTVPPNSSVAFPVGTVIEVAQVGAGQTTVVAGSGVTVQTPETLVLSGQWSTVSLRKRGTDEWLLAGDVEASA